LHNKAIQLQYATGQWSARHMPARKNMQNGKSRKDLRWRIPQTVQSNKTPGTEQHGFAVKKIFSGSLLDPPGSTGSFNGGWQGQYSIVISLNILYCW